MIPNEVGRSYLYRRSDGARVVLAGWYLGGSDGVAVVGVRWFGSITWRWRSLHSGELYRPIAAEVVVVVRSGSGLVGDVKPCQHDRCEGADPD